jgi:hypothetical protein
MKAHLETLQAYENFFLDILIAPTYVKTALITGRETDEAARTCWRI